MVQKRRIASELALFMVNNMANAMTLEQERRGVGKVQFAKECSISAPTYLSILEGKANPTLFLIARISIHSGLTVHELIHGYKR